jgi:nucleoside-diphosphate-sugar epimerase
MICPLQQTGVPASLYGLVDVRDVANAHVLAMEHPSAPGNRFICGSKDQYSYFEWAQRLKALYPNYPIPSFEQKPTTPKKNSTNNNKIQQVLGLKFTPLDDTLHAIVEVRDGFGRCILGMNSFYITLV